MTPVQPITLDAVEQTPARWRVVLAPLETYRSAARLFRWLTLLFAVAGVAAWLVNADTAWLWLGAVACLGTLGVAAWLTVRDARVSAGQEGV